MTSSVRPFLELQLPAVFLFCLPLFSYVPSQTKHKNGKYKMKRKKKENLAERHKEKWKGSLESHVKYTLCMIWGIKRDNDSLL